MIQPRTLAEYILDNLDRHRAELFLAEIDGRRLTYGEAREEIGQLWQLFRRAGLKPGDRVALLGTNSINWSLVYLAAVTYGAVAVPILPDFPAAAVRNILQLSESRALFISSSHLDSVEGGRIARLEHSFLLEDFQPFDLVEIPAFLKKIKVQVGLMRERAANYFASRRAPEAPHRPEPDDLAAIVYTSGTTGNSKGVMLSHRNIVSDILDAIVYVEVSPHDRLLSLLPLAHTYECTCGFLAPMSGGVSIHYLKGKPSPSVLLPAFQKVRPTLVFAVPLIIEKIYRKRVLAKIESKATLRAMARVGPLRKFIYRRAVKKLREALGGELREMGFGGASLSPEVERFLIEGRFPYAVGYGMTECSPLISGSEPWRTRKGSCGYPVEHIEVRIADKNPSTGIGEIQVRGPMVTRGYYKNPEATAALFTADGWLATGDLGYQDDDHFLFIVGRSKNVILGPSGENIYPEEVEHVLNENSGVLESVVIDRAGRLVALICPDYEVLAEELHFAGRSDKDVDDRMRHHFDQLLRVVNARLPSYSRIATYTLVEEEFEKTPTNKIKRYLYS